MLVCCDLEKKINNTFLDYFLLNSISFDMIVYLNLISCNFRIFVFILNLTCSENRMQLQVETKKIQKKNLKLDAIKNASVYFNFTSGAKGI